MQPPDWIKDAPDLALGLELYYEAFWDLTTCRPVGWTAQPIPWSAVIEWGQLNELDPEEMDDLIFYVRELDAEFLTWASEQSKGK